MKKIQLYIILFVVIVLFASTDYFVNTPFALSDLIPKPAEENIKITDTYPNLTEILLNSDPQGFGYTIYRRDRTQQLFEKFDLSSVQDIRIYRNVLSPRGGSGLQPMTVYEIQGPVNQGKISYLNVKMRIIDQKELTSNINEVSGYGYNSFFYNDLNNKNTGFLLSQVGDELYGFQYSKADTESFDIIKNMIDTLMLID
jgi:hypothetical protein